MSTLAMTGATRAVGTALVRYAIKNDWDVFCIVRPGFDKFDRFPVSDRLHFIEVDLKDLGKIQSTDVHADYFFHLGWANTTGAGRDDVRVQLCNIECTLDAVDLAHRLGCSTFLCTGSQSECGIVDKPIIADMPANPTTGYGIAKNSAYGFAELRCSQLGMDFKWVRILSCFGPYNNMNSFMAYCIEKLRANEPLNVTPCKQLWDYIYSDDAARMIFNIAEHGVNGRKYPIGTGHGMPLSEYVLTMKKVLKSSSVINFGAIPYYDNQAMYLVADNTAYENDIGKSACSDFETSFRKYVRFLGL